MPRLCPNSELRIEAFEQAMAAWQTANNPAKADAAAGKLLQIDPDNVRALANRCYVGRTRAMAGEAEALAPAVAAAERGLAALAKWQRPAAVAEADFARLKQQFAAGLRGHACFAALQAKDYDKGAHAHYLGAVTVDPDNLADIYQLSVAQLENQPIDVLGFWYAARAITVARAARNDSAAAGIDGTCAPDTSATMAARTVGRNSWPGWRPANALRQTGSVPRSRAR